jgi:glycosyltransferase involved in cell wall biosynthesis
VRLAILTWEYPPTGIGEIARYAHSLASEMSKRNLNTCVVTFDDWTTGVREEADGVEVFRISNPVKSQSHFLTWALSLTIEFERVVSDIYYSEDGGLNLLDAQEWITVPAAVSIKKALQIPFIFTVQSLEDHRSRGSEHPFNQSIKNLEWLGFYEAEKIIAKSLGIKDEVIRIYRVPPEKIEVINPDSADWINQLVSIYSEVAIGGL